jgi:hypothetical protein
MFVNRFARPLWRSQAVRIAAIGVVLSCGAGLGLAWAAEKLQSAWRTADIKIDGKNDDWQGGASYLEDQRISVGLLNDAEFLYVSVATSDVDRRSQLAAGLTLWLDATGKKKRTFGLFVPGVGGEGAGRGGGRYGGRGGQMDPDTLADRVNGPVEYVEVLGPGKDDRRRADLNQAFGVEIARGYHDGVIVYEIKIPLTQNGSSSIAVQTAAGRTIGLGLETPKPQQASQQGREGRGGGGGGGRGGIGGGRGGMGGYGGRGGMGRGGGMGGGGGVPGGPLPTPKPLNVWATAQLASGGK